jgi:hypothetical protein
MTAVMPMISTASTQQEYLQEGDRKQQRTMVTNQWLELSVVC